MSLLSRIGRMIRADLGALQHRRADPLLDDRSEDAPDRTPGAAPRDPLLAEYYANLELPYGADLDAVRAAYRRLMRRYHPDLHAADPEKRRVATELTQRLNQAHEALKRHLA